MQSMNPDDRKIAWKNVAEKHRLEDGLRIQRAPQKWVNIFAEGAAWRSLQSANVRMLLKTGSKRIGIRWKNNVEWSQFEVLGEVSCNGKRCATFSCRPCMENREDIFETPVSGENLWEIHFPWCAEIIIESILIDSGEKLSVVPADRRDVMFTYGSSITHGFSATRASGTWPCITAAALGIDFYNFGFGGAAFYEKEIAEYIASRRDWKYLTVEAGTNTCGGYETPASYRNTFDKFLHIIREKHPCAPVLCFTSTYYTDHDEKKIKNSKGYLIEDYRVVTREVVGTRMKNDSNLFLAEGLDWIGNGKHLSDTIHPNDEGMQLMGSGIATAWKKTPFFKDLSLPLNSLPFAHF